MGIHTCEAAPTGEGYVGIGVHRGARIAAAGHGGQVLLSTTTRSLLAEETDWFATRVVGEHRLKDLAGSETLYQLVGDGLEAEFPPLKTLDNRPTNLRTQPTPLVGRARELREVCELVGGGSRLVTLTGPGGAGKTRLAVQAAAELLDQFRDGAFFVPLAAHTDPELVLPAVAQTLGVTSAGIQTLEAYLADKELLLVLDNLEQVLDAAPQIAELSSQEKASGSSRRAGRPFGSAANPSTRFRRSRSRTRPSNCSPCVRRRPAPTSTSPGTSRPSASSAHASTVSRSLSSSPRCESRP